MKPMLFIVIAVFLYAIENVLIARHLTKVSPLAIMPLLYGGLLLCIVPLSIWQARAKTIAFPTQENWYIVLICAVLLFCADYCFFSSYTSGGHLMLVTTGIALFPGVASGIHVLCEGQS